MLLFLLKLETRFGLSFHFYNFFLLFYIPGKIPVETLKFIWGQKGFNTSIQEKILSILEKFEIIYCYYKNETSKRGNKTKKNLNTLQYLIVPSLLPLKATRSEYEHAILPSPKDKENVITHKREIHLKFIALGFFSRLIIRFLNINSYRVQEIWLNGIVLKDNFGDQALILCSIDHSQSRYLLTIVTQFSPPNDDSFNQDSPNQLSPSILGENENEEALVKIQIEDTTNDEDQDSIEFEKFAYGEKNSLNNCKKMTFFYLFIFIFLFSFIFILYSFLKISK